MGQHSRTDSTALRLLRDGQQTGLQQKLGNYHSALWAEARAVAIEALVQALAEVDRALDQCLIVPQMRFLPPETQTAVKESVKRSLKTQIMTAWEENQRVTEQRRQRARPVRQPVVEKVVVSPITCESDEIKGHPRAPKVEAGAYTPYYQPQHIGLPRRERPC